MEVVVPTTTTAAAQRFQLAPPTIVSVENAALRELFQGERAFLAELKEEEECMTRASRIPVGSTLRVGGVAVKRLDGKSALGMRVLSEALSGGPAGRVEGLPTTSLQTQSTPSLLLYESLPPPPPPPQRGVSMAARRRGVSLAPPAASGAQFQSQKSLDPPPPLGKRKRNLLSEEEEEEEEEEVLNVDVGFVEDVMGGKKIEQRKISGGMVAPAVTAAAAPTTSMPPPPKPSAPLPHAPQSRGVSMARRR